MVPPPLVPLPEPAPEPDVGPLLPELPEVAPLPLPLDEVEAPEELPDAPLPPSVVPLPQAPAPDSPQDAMQVAASTESTTDVAFVIGRTLEPAAATARQSAP